ncbi:MAG: hypothetical protein U0R24_15890 [Solirubrobacterales bacterium]
MLTFLQRILRREDYAPTLNKPLDLHGFWRIASGVAAGPFAMSFL